METTPETGCRAPNWDCQAKLTTDKNMTDDPSLGCCCCHCWCHEMGDWCKLPNGWPLSPNLDPDASYGSECPLGSVLSGHSRYSKWETGIKGNTQYVRRFKCTECEKGTYKDVTGRYDGLIICPPGSPPASLDTYGLGLRYIRHSIMYTCTSRIPTVDGDDRWR